jgi:ribosomal protein S12 methylthiotransferase accessory factor
MNTYQYTKQLLDGIERLDIMKDIYNLSGSFYDEPRFFYFAASIGPSSYYKIKGYSKSPKIEGGGLSFNSPELALLKSMGEGIERFAQVCYNPKKIITITYKQLQKKGIKAIDPICFGFLQDAQTIKLGWTEGFVPESNDKILIPAQLLFLTWRKYANEPFITENITTGAAAGSTKEQAILSGLYEAVERDATMSAYLNRIPLSPFELKTIDDERIQKMITVCYRYRITPYIFDATNDVGVPVYITLLYDATNGPVITVGSKADLNQINAIYHSIEEAFMGRMYVRRVLLKEPSASIDKLSPLQITSNKAMYLYWASKKNRHRLGFLLGNTCIPFDNKNHSNHSTQDSLRFVLKRLQSIHMSVYVVNLTLPELEKCNFHVYKAIVPGLQPLYIDQSRPFFNRKRLKRVAAFFGQKQPRIYPFPHPFP